MNYGYQSSCLLLSCLSYSSTLPPLRGASLHAHPRRTVSPPDAAPPTAAKLSSSPWMDYNWEEDDEAEGGVLLAR